MTLETVELDWRGMRCPEPILKTARQVRKLRDGTARLIQIYADDDAFPLDIASWCQSAGIALMGVEERDGFYQATLQLAADTQQPHASPLADDTHPPILVMRDTFDTSPSHILPADMRRALSTPQSTSQTLDCTGMACPEPILKLARAYRKLDEGGALTIIADDDAFLVDLKSWLKSSGALLVSLRDGAPPYSATLRRPSTAQDVSSQAAQALAAPALAQQPVFKAKVAETITVKKDSSHALHLDLNGLSWENALARLESLTQPAWAGETLEVRTSHGSHLQQTASWLTSVGHQLIRFDADQGLIVLGVSAGKQAAPESASSHELVPVTPTKRATFLVIHNDFESLMAALMIANTTAAQDIQTSIFFSFWGVNLLRSDRPRVNEPQTPMTFIHRMFRWMMPIGPSRQPLSKMHFGGAGKAMMLASMRQQNVMDLETLMESAIESGVRFTVCTMSMSIMGIQKRDIMESDNIEFAGVASFVADSASSDISMVF